MSQFELYEHIVALIKNAKSKILSHQLNDIEMYNKIKILNDSIDIMKIYKEMRKIILMPYKNTEIDDIDQRMIDTKCRLTFIKWITQIEHKLKHGIYEFKELKCSLLQAKRIEQKIVSPAIRNRRKFYNTRTRLSPDLGLKVNIWDQWYRSRVIKLGNHTLVPDINRTSNFRSPQMRTHFKSFSNF